MPKAFTHLEQAFDISGGSYNDSLAGGSHRLGYGSLRRLFGAGPQLSRRRDPTAGPPLPAAAALV